MLQNVPKCPTCNSHTHTHRYYSFCWPTMGGICAQGCLTFIRSVCSSPFSDILSINLKTAVCIQHMQGPGTENPLMNFFIWWHHLNLLQDPDLHYLFSHVPHFIEAAMLGVLANSDHFVSLNTSLGLEDKPCCAGRTIIFVRYPWLSALRCLK